MPWIVNHEFHLDTEVGMITCDVEIDVTSDPIIVRFVQLNDTVEILAQIRDYIKNHIEENACGQSLRDKEREWQEADRAEEEREERLLGDDEC